MSEEIYGNSAFSSESESDNESYRSKKRKVKVQRPNAAVIGSSVTPVFTTENIPPMRNNNNNRRNIAALDVAYAAYRNSPLSKVSNITTLVNNSNGGFTPTQEQNLKATICSTILGTTPPLNFNCDFCWDDQSFYNVTTFCLLRSVYNNAFNQSSFDHIGWFRDIDYCRWLGIKCDNSNNIVELNLEFPNIPRVLENRIGALTTLQKLSIIGGLQLPNNQLPVSMFSMSNLQTLILTATGFTGPIPNTFNKMTSLKSLQFRQNLQLTEPIPDSIASTSLDVLIYTQQNVSGPIPDFIGNSPTLQQSLESLDLSNNLFTGNIPNSLMNLTKLRILGLGTNLLTGDFPFLAIISSRFAKTLANLSIQQNTFTGVIPPSLAQCDKLQIINLAFNSFTGSIPAELSTLNDLGFLTLSGNKLTGNIPDSLGNLKFIRLDLNNNLLTGPIPASICQNTYSFCNLQENQLSPLPTTCNVCTL
ncbi:LRR receptor-like serine/threonine-protein kinase ERECTA [Rhizophagus clarus]|uniref:LRR receptor-like serine/threonine-protein kinase ERECTA n=1 Tax=Rhizophagus clarus TaxID=94130 RepID=A0A8H3QHC0_9GLOM|nr:LRR receptor-like serine/threonine-protein kinase ERECTA [Rhizophagus clarus]